MAARRSWLHIRQSLCSLLPCRRLPDRIREASYRRGMKMSESWLSCSASCGTFLFGFLWESSRLVWVPKGHIAPIRTVVKMAVQIEDRVTLHGPSCLRYRKYAHLAP